VKEYTFAMIKPAAVEANQVGAIINIIEEHGFRISAIKKLIMSKKEAQGFYIDHKEKPFFDELTNFMSSSDVITMILTKQNAIKDFRKLIGSTNPEEAAEGTIRKRFAKSMRKNAVHGSDSKQSAEREANYFFSNLERF
jgi:nucleoside-diphosphate kinase